MTVIKNLAFVNKKKLKDLASFSESNLNFSAFSPFPIDFIHHFLPLKFKILSESFVALEDDKIMGLLTVNKTGGKKVKITRLLLDEGSVSVGKMLVNCVINVYFSKGAENFYVVADETNKSMIDMFCKGCGFKDFGYELSYKISKDEIQLSRSEINFEHIRKMTGNDIKEAKELSDSAVYSCQRSLFCKTTEDFKNPFLKREQYVLVSKNKIFGYFSIIKLNRDDYILDFVITPAYEGYLTDIIEFAEAGLINGSSFKNLYIKLKSCYINFKGLKEILDMEYKINSTNKVLVKDFLVSKKREFNLEQMIFNDITPAY